MRQVRTDEIDWMRQVRTNELKKRGSRAADECYWVLRFA